MNETPAAPTSAQQILATLGSVRFWAAMAVLTVVIFALATVAYNTGMSAEPEPAPRLAASSIHPG